MPYPEIDLSAITTQSIAQRASKVTLGDLVTPPSREETALFERLPNLLSVKTVRELAKKVASAKRRGYPLIYAAGAHLVKVGLGPLLIALARDGLLDCLAVNGAFVIHDLELAHFGKTSEDVAEQLPNGRFGMSAETAELVNGGFRLAIREGIGAGEALGRLALEGENASISVLAQLHSMSIPVTVHVALGTDIVHMHPNCDGGAIGESSLRDFRILCHRVKQLSGESDELGGCFLNIGSAVILPEVFLKAVSVARNLGMKGRFTTAVFDFIRQYRALENVVRRPSPGDGSYIIGPHELLLPLFYSACLLESDG
ncbi:hypothetical protein K8R78_06480 [bacterium]|nr:hypothetical protein [bacterium]